ncbi:MAG: ABC transporter permease [Candidatus Sericytochromatia bacterium]|nr:ABC transporter permease [Candidatus Sericytochromatia bacterium]
MNGLLSPFTRFIAWRQLRQRWRQTLLSVGTVALGVMVQIVALSLANGFENDLVTKVLGTNPHISLTPVLSDRVKIEPLRSDLARIPHVRQATPAIKTQALITDGVGTTGILLFGIDPALEGDSFQDYMLRGKLSQGTVGDIVLGVELAKKMGWRVGDAIQVITGVDHQLSCRVTGIFQAGLYELDVRAAYVNLPSAQVLLDLGTDVQSLTVRLDDPMRAPEIGRQISAQWPAFQTRNWLESNKSLMSAMALEKRVIFLVMLFLILIAIVGMANTLVMIVVEKTPDIGIMRAMGASQQQIRRLFMLQGICVGGTGVVAGCLLGYGVSLILARFPMNLPNDVYYIEKLPVLMQPIDFLLVAAAALAICVTASVVPARRAASLDPIETIRRSQS